MHLSGHKRAINVGGARVDLCCHVVTAQQRLLAFAVCMDNEHSCAKDDWNNPYISCAEKPPGNEVDAYLGKVHVGNRLKNR